jgi:hypothetical protein
MLHLNDAFHPPSCTPTISLLSPTTPAAPLLVLHSPLPVPDLRPLSTGTSPLTRSAPSSILVWRPSCIVLISARFQHQSTNNSYSQQKVLCEVSNVCGYDHNDDKRKKEKQNEKHIISSQMKGVLRQSYPNRLCGVITITPSVQNR